MPIYEYTPVYYFDEYEQDLELQAEQNLLEYTDGDLSGLLQVQAA